MRVQPDTSNHIPGNDAMVERIEATAAKDRQGFTHDHRRLQAHALEANTGERGSVDGRGDAATGKALHGTLASALPRPKEIGAGHRPSPSRGRTGVLFPLVVALILVTSAASATDFADPTISTDRPGIPYGTSIVPTGHLQLETGLPTFENDPLPGGHSLLMSTPTYLRYGVSDDFEVQLAASPWNRLTTTQDGHRHAVSGAGDLQLGGKFALNPGGGGMPAVTLIGYITVPTGNRNFSEGRPAYNLNAVASWSLTGSTSFTTMASFTRAPVDGDRHTNTGTLAASLSHSFTSQLTAYAEAGWFPGYTNRSSTALAGAGVTCLLTPNVQVDGFFDLGLNHDSPASVLGTGVSILF